MMTDYVRIRETIADPMSRAEIQAYVSGAVDLFLRAHGGEAKDAGPSRGKRTKRT